jgi:uncharacterized protein (DUF58 family)
LHQTAGELIVTPDFQRLSEQDFFRFVAQAGHGDASSLAAGDTSHEYCGSREYVPGAAVRRWDYSSWARLGRPIVREYSSQHRPEIAIFLDLRPSQTSPRESNEPDEIMESQISLAAALGEFAVRHNCRLTFLFDGRQLHKLTAAAVGDGILPRLLELLARAGDGCDQEFFRNGIDTFKSQRLPAFALVVSNRGRVLRDRFCRELTHAGCQVLGLQVAADGGVAGLPAGTRLAG